ncbi:MAG: hypothetical protein AAF573_19185 [Bacteroidota bacterium]
MKHFNLVYLLFFVVIAAVWQLNQRYGKHTIMFYGFAETKETEINLDHPVEVNRLYITPGQKVKEGTLLAEVTQSSFGLKLGDIDFSIEKLRTEEEIWKADKRSTINRLQAQKIAKESDINAQIIQLETQMEINKSLLEGLKSIDTSEAPTVNPTQVKIDNLKKELALVVRPMELQIDRLEEELNASNNPKRVQIRRLQKEKEYYFAEKEKLSIYAPKDGLIGNIYVKEKENISSFRTLISFYEQNPTMVKGFVHENLILQVAVGDTLEAVSSQHPEHKCQGIVTGLGSRIVEIPERLRKTPELKTYGREVLIAIPPSNHFLQKEKVMLSLIGDEAESVGFFNANLDKNEKQNNKVITEKE